MVSYLMYMQWGRKHIEGGGGLDLQKKILTRKKMNLDHTNALLFVPFTRSRGGGGGGWENFDKQLIFHNYG